VNECKPLPPTVPPSPLTVCRLYGNTHRGLRRRCRPRICLRICLRRRILPGLLPNLAAGMFTRGFLHRSCLFRLPLLPRHDYTTGPSSNHWLERLRGAARARAQRLRRQWRAAARVQCPPRSVAGRPSLARPMVQRRGRVARWRARGAGCAPAARLRHVWDHCSAPDSLRLVRPTGPERWRVHTEIELVTSARVDDDALM
jgi:hypothetical protein